jgi:hypothetical protein
LLINNWLSRGIKQIQHVTDYNACFAITWLDCIQFGMLVTFWILTRLHNKSSSYLLISTTIEVDILFRHRQASSGVI